MLNISQRRALALILAVGACLVLVLILSLFALFGPTRTRAASVGLPGPMKALNLVGAPTLRDSPFSALPAEPRF